MLNNFNELAYYKQTSKEILDLVDFLEAQQQDFCDEDYITFRERVLKFFGRTYKEFIEEGSSKRGYTFNGMSIVYTFLKIWVKEFKYKKFGIYTERVDMFLDAVEIMTFSKFITYVDYDELKSKWLVENSSIIRRLLVGVPIVDSDYDFLPEYTGEDQYDEDELNKDESDKDETVIN